MKRIFLFFIICTLLVSCSKNSFANESLFISSKSYDPHGEYLFFGDTSKKQSIKTGSNIRMDEDGIPLVKQGKEYVYNPDTIAQFGLQEYSYYVKDNDKAHLDSVRAVADWLVENQDKSGAWIYHYSYNVGMMDYKLEAPWTSAMTQGVVISALVRSYHIFKTEKYLTAAEKALSPLTKDVSKGGLKRDLFGYTFYEEYPTEPGSFALNGFMFTLFGLYDLSIETGSKRAKKLYSDGISTLKSVLPYYDQGNISAYHLGHLTKPPRKVHTSWSYHKVHVIQLEKLAEMTNDKTIRFYYDLWKDYKEVEKVENKDPYQSLLSKFPVNSQGLGLDTYATGLSEQAETYGLVLASESLRYKKIPTQEGVSRIKNAVSWLLKNKDLDGDGIPGWGLPQAWDAFSDGTENPPNQAYTISNALIFEGLLEALSIKKSGGYFWYSSNNNDSYFTPNVSSAFLGVLARLVHEHPNAFDTEEKEFIITKIDLAAKSIISKVKYRDGLPYWDYIAIPNKLNHEKPNDLVHHAYILWGMESYRTYLNHVKIPWSLNQSVNSLNSFWKNGRLYDFPQNITYTGEFEAYNERPSILWGNGMLLAFYARWNEDEKANQLLSYTQKNYGDWPNITVWPSWFIKNENFYPRYTSHILWGLSYYDYYQ